MFEFNHENISEIFFNGKNISFHMVSQSVTNRLSEWLTDWLTDEPQELLELLFVTKKSNHVPGCLIDTSQPWSIGKIFLEIILREINCK